ncbi:MAG: hypothetical protein OQJ98_02250 [Candidatus Pacebacteria bacterium]|nr:hypothetical protein [Candidatus Paceibacterota bacterium]
MSVGLGLTTSLIVPALNVWGHIFFTLVFFGIPAHLMRHRYYGRVVVYAGMESGPLIALGIPFLIWPFAYLFLGQLIWWGGVLVAILFIMLGIFFVYKGLLEGPIYGW